MTWLDILLLLPLLIGLVRGLMRGLISELIAITAVVLGFVGARLWGADFAHWLMQQFTWPEAVCNTVAYALIFLAIAVVLNILGRLFSKLLKAIHLGFINRLFGGLFGVAKYGLVVLVVTFCLHSIDSRWHILNSDLKAKSVVYPEAVELSEYLLSITPYEDLSLPRI